ncbi:hypothetical protein LUX33_26515 [Actinomadura madurae]|uniref:hypothetical protein n=1 Tax=Actinomadura madurae TaxID=1993 RepID=UPI0020D2600B|nr:hypothetical protein [Actinomadura madurae]MCP9951631.1 hypothetical protein [Actinomadura madurae]MCP9968408.1 hypothetical protein [Actinomadura madurae]
MFDQRERRAVLDRAAGARDASGLFGGVSARLRRLVGFQAAAWSATDPETGLITAPMRVENLGSGDQCFTYWECAILEETVIPFRELARAAVPAAGLAASTGGLPARSAQYRKLLGRQGVGDELRAVLRAGGRPWGVVSLFRDKGRPRSIQPRSPWSPTFPHRWATACANSPGPSGRRPPAGSRIPG